MKPSVFHNEQKLLKSILALHAPDGIELDPMYCKGHFYRDIPVPALCFDINPQMDNVIWGDACNLDIEAGSINCMILDPPFMFGNHGKQKEYYASRVYGILKSFVELEILYRGILAEAYRVLRLGGTLLFKCQDYTDSKTTFTHCHVWEWATQYGFYPKDLAILHLPGGKVWNSKLRQRHLRKVHTYFWVFIKKRAKV